MYDRIGLGQRSALIDLLKANDYTDKYNDSELWEMSAFVTDLQRRRIWAIVTDPDMTPKAKDFAIETELEMLHSLIK